jgi:SPP1 gp7 family putative phage head morphogenesis protein
MTRRFRAIIRLINESIITNDCFGLNNQQIPLEAAGPNQFDFPRNDKKIEAFMLWLAEQVRENIFEVVTRERIGGAISQIWMNTYIDSAYKQGVRRAKQELRKQNVDLPRLGNEYIDEVTAAFNSPVHADRVGVVYTRAFNELRGITDAMDQQLSRVLAEGLVNGWGTERIALNIVDRVEKIGLTRARMLARTEVIRAHHLATIQEYRNAELLEVEIQAEFNTAGDGRVCVICKGLNGKIMTLSEAEGIIPVHPNCRCVSLPHIPD